jgi:glutaconate CoA-transferase, subunit A
MKRKVMGMTEAAALVADGSSLAIGGHTSRRHPMAFLYELVRQGRKRLHLMGWNNGPDFDLLVGAGCASTVETSYVGMGSFGLANNYRRAAEAGQIEIIEHTETTAIDMFRATAMGIGFLPTRTPLGTDFPRYNKRMKEMVSPFDGTPYIAVEGVTPDVAIIHAHSADAFGNVQLDRSSWTDNTVDILIAKSPKKLIVTVEQIVSEAAVYADPMRTVIPRVFVTAVVEAPYGAHPCCCDSRYDYDLEFLRKYKSASESQESFDGFLSEYVRGVSGHEAYLEKIGVSHLMSITSNRLGGADV